MSNLISKTLRYKGEDVPVFFRELSGGEALELTKGQTAQHTQVAGEVASVTMEIDMGDRLEGNMRLTYFTLVTAEAKQVYPTWQQFLKEKQSKITALQKLAAEASREFAESEEDAAAGKE